MGEGGGPDRRALIERLPEAIVVMAHDLTITYVNGRLLDHMGYTADEAIGTNIFDYVHPDDHDYLANTWASRSASPGEIGILIQARGKHADGSWRAFEILGLSMFDVPEVDGMVMTLRDLGRKAAKVGDARFRSMVDRTTDVVLVVDHDGHIGYANRRLTSRYGIDQDEVVGTAFTTLVADDDRAGVSAWFAALVAAGDRAEDRIRVGLAGHPDRGRPAPTVEWHGTNQIDDPMIEGVILSGRDVTELVEMERRLAAQTEQLRHSADHDALTGLLNRRAFRAEVSEVLAERRALGDDGDAVVLFCDLDRFKQVNDTHGHGVGDHVLKVVADRLRSSLKARDVVARWGGDEFAVLLDGSPSPQEVGALDARLRTRLGTPITDDGITTVVGVTVGVSRAAASGAEVDDLLDRADAAMYAQKTGGRSS